ncbi:MAG: response regulator [Caldilineaceae bacterium]|nr:response regulator [Caldilineaceae bacterium]
MERQNLKVLLVEDAPVHIEIMQRHLADQAVELVVATNKSDALYLLKERYFHVALLDIKLDGDDDSGNQDGLEIAKTIQAADEATSVIMLTGFGTVQRTREALLKYGASDFLEKSKYEKEELVVIIEKVAEQALTRFQKKYITPINEHTFISQESLAKMKAELRYEQQEGFTGLLTDLLQPLLPVLCTPQANEQIITAADGVRFSSHYWSRMEGKGVRVAVGPRDAIRDQIQAYETQPLFLLRSRHSMVGFRYGDAGLKAGAFLQI